jgi:hypothetical protein
MLRWARSFRYYDYDFRYCGARVSARDRAQPKLPPAHQWLAEQLSALKRFDEALRKSDARSSSIHSR